MNYENYKQICQEEIKATQCLYNRSVVSGVFLEQESAEDIINFISKHSGKFLSPTSYLIVSSKSSFQVKDKICKLYNKKLCKPGILGLSFYMLSQLVTKMKRVKNNIFKYYIRITSR